MFILIYLSIYLLSYSTAESPFIPFPRSVQPRFFNMKKSTRGSIRKAPNAISWVFSLVNMSTLNKTLDPSNIIRSWSLCFNGHGSQSLCSQTLALLVLFSCSMRNDTAAKHDKLVGAKLQAVKILLDLPESSQSQLLQTVSIYGWDGSL